MFAEWWLSVVVGNGVLLSDVCKLLVGACCCVSLVVCCVSLLFAVCVLRFAVVRCLLIVG